MTWRALLKRELVWVALPIIFVLLIMAFLAPWIAPHDPNHVDLSRKLLPVGSGHLLGTDHLGRDILSRLIWGTRTSMGSVVVIITLILLLGLVVGGVAGYYGGWVDSLLMRTCEVFLTFPTFVLAMFLVAVLGTGLTNVILAIVLTHWAWYARIIRSLVISLKVKEYVLAARVSGTGAWPMLWHHFLPTVLSQVAILATLDIGHIMLHVSGLSFLGLGIQPPTPEWGVMINDARQYIWTQPELITLPGIMILVSVLAFNIPGDALRDSLDPTLLAENR